MAFWYDLRRRLFQDPDRGAHPRQPYALVDRQMYSAASSDNMRPRIVRQKTLWISCRAAAPCCSIWSQAVATLPDGCWILSREWHITMTIRSGGLLPPRT